MCNRERRLLAHKKMLNSKIKDSDVRILWRWSLDFWNGYVKNTYILSKPPLTTGLITFEADPIIVDTNLVGDTFAIEICS